MPSAYISFILFFLLLALGFGDAPVLYDSDTAWHLAAGDLIRSTHAIPLTDPWSFTASGETWYNLSWLYDAGLSWIFSLGGFSAVYALTIITFAACIILMVHHCIQRGASLAILLLLVIPTMVTVYTGTIARPNMCSMLLTLVFYFILRKCQDSGHARHLFLLVPLMCLWANLHGGFLMAFPLLGFFMLESILKHNHRQARIYAVIITLCLAASLINPYGLSVYYGAYRTLFARFSNHLLEWHPAQIGHDVPLTTMLVLVLMAGNFFDKTIPFADRTLAFFMLLLSLASIRHSPLAALLMLPYLSLRFSTLFYSSRFSGRIRKFDTGLAKDMQEPGIRITALIMVLAAIVNLYSPFPRDAILKQPVGFREYYFPEEEARYVSDHYSGLRFFNAYNIGGYLDYLWRGKTRVFVDGRANSLYSDELLDDYTEFSETRGFGGRSEMIARKYKFDGLIVENRAGDSYLWDWNPHWKRVYKGKVATIYLRSDRMKQKPNIKDGF